MADCDSPEPRPAHFRRRAAKACLSCRKRKVRCDVAQRDTPCTNCFLDKQKCEVKPRPTKYRVSSARIEASLVGSNHTPPNKQTAHQVTAEEQVNNFQKNTYLSERERQNENFNDRNTRSITSSGENLSDSAIEEIRRESPRGQKPATDAGYHSEGTFLEDITQTLFSYVDTPEQIELESRSTVDNHVIYSFYPFLKHDNLSHMPPQDVNFIEQQGCFRVPSRPAIDEFMEEYFLHVHPSLPMIDEGEFWAMFGHRGSFPPRNQMSLFVFQAMLFASCSFVSHETIRSLGFSSTRSARGCYYRRAKLLFDFNGESDSLLTAQGALLLSYNSSMQNQKRVNSFWLGIAIQFAKDAGAHRYHTNKSFTAERRNALKRLWWCCITRDRILPLGVRRPINISSADFDFLAAPLMKEDFESEIHGSRVYDETTKLALTGLFLTLCDLAVALTDTLMVAYPLSGTAETISLDPLGVELALHRVSTCKARLNGWYDKASVCFPTPAGLGDVHESVILYTNLMYMYYHSAVIALYNHELYVIATGSGQEPRWDHMRQGKRQLEEGSAGMTESLKELIQLKLSKYMPTSVVAYAALPLVLHILDVKLSNSPSQNARKQGRLKIYTEAMKAWKSQYDGTDEVSEFIVRMVDYISLGATHPQDPGLRSPTHISHKSPQSHQTTSPLPLRYEGRSTAQLHEWSDLLLKQPRLYARLTLTIDLALSKGSFPCDSDFPIALQSQNIFGNRFPLYRITMDDPASTSVATRDKNSGRESQSSEYQHHSPLNSRTLQELNDFTKVALDPEEFGQDIHHSLIHSPIPISTDDISMYMGIYDMDAPERSCTTLDVPPIWADGMYSEENY